VYWSGFHKVRDQWNAEAYEAKCAEVYGQALDEVFEEAQDFADQFPSRWRARIFKDVIEDFIDLERTYRFLRWHDASPSDMEDVFYYGDYYSDRKVGVFTWDDEPQKEWVSRYPAAVKSARCGSRRRAGEDEWFTLSVCVLL
jgi:hypothetical protein